MFKIAVTKGMFSVALVASSCAVIWKQPSPSIATTRCLGRPTLAPIAAGTAKPIVPRPPELIQWRGFSNVQNWDAYIWCWPTPATRIVSSSACARRRSTQYCGFSGPSGCWS